MTVFLDTVGLLALWNESDQWHKAAQESFSQLLVSRANVVTTTFILLECGNAAARRPYRGTVARLHQQMEDGGRLVVPTSEDWKSAWANFDHEDQSGAGIVDHVSFMVMRRLGIARAFTNDRHFTRAGFETLF